MKQDIWNTYHYPLQVVSIAFGYFLMIGLSSDGIWIDTFISMLIIVLSSIEALWLKEIKNISTIHWTGVGWIFLASAGAYIVSDSSIVKGIFFWIMLISIYINLYRTCYYEPLSFKYVRNIIKDFPILCMYYIKAFFRRTEELGHRSKQQKRIVGILVLIVVLVSIFFPLYILADRRMGTLLELIFIEAIFKMPIWIICALMGLIPAIVNYSIVRGLVDDIVLQNPHRDVMTTISINTESVYFNETVIKILIIGLLVVNVIYEGMQIDYLFRLVMYHEGVDSLYNMDGVFPLLVALGIGILFIVLSEYYILHKGRNLRISHLVFAYVLSLIAILLSVIYRYGLKVANYGIEEVDILGLGSVLLLGILLTMLLRNMLLNNTEIIQKLVLWGTILFVVGSLFPIEYCVSQINVQVFLDKYERGEISEIVTGEDIDLAFLQQMEYEAVPALVRLMDVKLPYETTNETFDEIVKQMVVEMFYIDMSDEEIVEIGALETEKEKDKFMEILNEKIEYRVISKKKMAFTAFCEKLGGVRLYKRK